MCALARVYRKHVFSEYSAFTKNAPMALQLKYRGKTAKGKGRQPLLLLESLTRCELGSKKRTSGVDEVDVASGSGPRGNLDDPVSFFSVLCKIVSYCVCLSVRCSKPFRSMTS